MDVARPHELASEFSNGAALLPITWLYLLFSSITISTCCGGAVATIAPHRDCARAGPATAVAGTAMAAAAAIPSSIPPASRGPRQWQKPLSHDITHRPLKTHPPAQHRAAARPQ